MFIFRTITIETGLGTQHDLYLLGLDNPGVEIVIKSPQNTGGYVLSIKGGRQRVLWDHGGSTRIQLTGSRWVFWRRQCCLNESWRRLVGKVACKAEEAASTKAWMWWDCPQAASVHDARCGVPGQWQWVSWRWARTSLHLYGTFQRCTCPEYLGSWRYFLKQTFIILLYCNFFLSFFFFWLNLEARVTYPTRDLTRASCSGSGES